MYLSKEHHVSRHVPYKKLLRDKDDNPVGILPQAFEMRDRDDKALSVNWLEFFGGTHASNIVDMIQNFRLSRNGSIGKLSVFAIGKVGELEDTCDKLGHTKVRVLCDGKKKSKNNDSHSRIIRLPINDVAIMQSLATDVFIERVPNKNIP